MSVSFASVLAYLKSEALSFAFRSRAKRAPRRSERRPIRPTLELLERRELLAATFFAPAEPSGSVTVQLQPLANVTVGAPEVVTFGMPFARGSVTPDQLSQVRVLKGGVEIPAFVELLTPWRSISDPGLDGQSVRVARLQIAPTFSSTSAPTSVTVQWGGPARTLNRATFQDPRLNWHTVTSGSFVAADNVEEPDVLAVLPKEHLVKGLLDARTSPVAAGVAEGRDDPAVMDTRTFSGYEEFDYAQKNFFYSLVNENPGTTITYKTSGAAWLYDRGAAMYELYLRSGFGKALREAIRNTDYYSDRLTSSGFFTLASGSDPKYSYNESLAYTLWLTGDNRVLPQISTVVGAHNGTGARWSPTRSFWTERNAGYKLLANAIGYEVTGSTTYKNAVQTIVADLQWHQDGAGGQLPANRVDGGLYHTGQQHDISEASSASVLIASPWMSAYIVDPMVRVYGLTESAGVADFIRRMGNFEKVASKTDAGGQFGGTRRYPDYLMRYDGTSDRRSSSDVQHASDVGGVAAWATYFAELRGTPDASLRQLANDLYSTYEVGVNYWTRPGGTNYNVSPSRRYNWEYKNSASYSWALTGTGASQTTFQFSAAGATAGEAGGSIVITVTRAGDLSTAASVGYASGGGTATAGADYTAVSGTLSFAAGETSKTFTVPLLDDALVEGDETVTLTLSNPAGGTLGSPGSAVLTIVSDDIGTPPAGVGLKAEFFDFTTSLSALPDLSGRTPDVTRTDATLNYAPTTAAWAGLDSRFVDTFAARHTGYLKVDVAGSYTLYLNSDSGSKLWLDGALVINNDGSHTMRERAVTRTLSAGYHALRLEYFENVNAAGLILSWAGPGIAKQVVPAAQLFQATPEAPAGVGLHAEFFDFTTSLSALPDLSGRTPDVTRTDATLNYAPTTAAWAGLDSRFVDTFAARHTGYLKVDVAGSYTLYLNSDSGSKLWLDGALVINNDGSHTMRERAVTRTLSAGYHALRLEYFENVNAAGLIFSWAGPGFSKQVVSADHLFEDVA